MAIKKNLPLDDNKQRLTLGVRGKKRENEASEPSLFNSQHAGVEMDENIVFTVGERLRFEREKNGYSLHEMADILRLRPRQIQALEDGNYDNLPGQAFVVGFLRSYANALGLDAVAIVDLYKHEHAGQMAAPQLAFPEPTSEGRMPGSGLLIGTCIVAALAFGGWYFYLNENKGSVENVPELPNRLTALLQPENETQNNAGESSSSSPGNIQNEPLITGVNGPSADSQVAALASEKYPAEADTVGKSPLGEDANQPTTVEVAPSIEGEPQTEIEIIDTMSQAEEAIERQIEPALPESPSIPEDSQIPIEETTEIPQIAEDAGSDNSALQASTDEENTAQQTQSEVPDQPIPESGEIAQLDTPKEIEEAVEQIVEKQPDTQVSSTSQSVAADDIPVFKQETLSAQMPGENSQDIQTGEAEMETDVSEPENLGIHNTDARIVLMARQEVWVQIIGDTKNIILERLLRPGDTFMVPAEDNLKLTTANAAGLEIRLDGQMLSSLGGFGAIVRDLDLDPLRLKEQFTVTQ